MGRKKKRTVETELLNRSFDESPQLQGQSVSSPVHERTSSELYENPEAILVSDEQIQAMVDEVLPGSSSARESSSRANRSLQSPRGRLSQGSSSSGAQNDQAEYVAMEELEPLDDSRAATPPRRFSREYEPPRGPFDSLSSGSSEENAERKHALMAVLHHGCCTASIISFILMLIMFIAMDIASGYVKLGLRISCVLTLWFTISTFLLALVYFFIHDIGPGPEAEVDPMSGFGACGRTGYGWPPALAFLDSRLLKKEQRAPIFILVMTCLVGFGVAASIAIMGRDIPVWVLFVPWWALMLLLPILSWLVLLARDVDSVSSRVAKLANLCHLPVLFFFFGSFTFLFMEKAALNKNYTWDWVFFPLWCAVGVAGNIGCFCPALGTFSAFDYRRDDRLARQAWRHDEEYLGVRCQHRVLEVWLRVIWTVANFCCCLTGYIACKHFNLVDEGKHVPLFAVLAPLIAGGCFFALFDGLIFLIQCLLAVNGLEDFMDDDI